MSTPGYQPPVADAPTGSRVVQVNDGATGMRLDRWLSRRFADRSRSAFSNAIRAGQVRDASGRVLDCAYRVRGGELLHLYVPGIAPGTAPPPFPPILFEGPELVAVDKPAGLLAHPIVSKYIYHLPLYRQESMLGRLGWEVTRSTLCDQILACAGVLTPLYRLTCEHVLLSTALHTDDTPLALLAPMRTAHAWVYVGSTLRLRRARL